MLLCNRKNYCICYGNICSNFSSFRKRFTAVENGQLPVVAEVTRVLPQQAPCRKGPAQYAGHRYINGCHERRDEMTWVLANDKLFGRS